MWWWRLDDVKTKAKLGQTRSNCFWDFFSFQFRESATSAFLYIDIYEVCKMEAEDDILIKLPLAVVVVAATV